MESVFSEGGRYLVTQGFLGLAVLALGWMVYAYKSELARSWAERLADWKAVSEVMAANSVAISEHNATSTARTRASEAIAQAQQLAAGEQSRLILEVERLREANSELRAEIIKLREEVVRRGGLT